VLSAVHIFHYKELSLQVIDWFYWLYISDTWFSIFSFMISLWLHLSFLQLVFTLYYLSGIIHLFSVFLIWHLMLQSFSLSLGHLCVLKHGYLLIIFQIILVVLSLLSCLREDFQVIGNTHCCFI
jgi:hypothetical protein